MSLFRTLQHSPATVSIFHNSKIPLSSKLYQVLTQADLLSKKDNFIIDLMQDRMPTYDQYQLLVSNCVRDAESRGVLKQCFPILVDRTASGNDKRVTTRGVLGSRLFSEGEYQIMNEVFNKAQEGADSVAPTDPSEIFKAPLVVDWDQNKIAGDEEGLKRILEKYNE